MESYKDIKQLINLLETIKAEGSGSLNLAKAIYLLAMEIQDIKEKLKDLEK